MSRDFAIFLFLQSCTVHIWWLSSNFACLHDKRLYMTQFLENILWNRESNLKPLYPMRSPDTDFLSHRDWKSCNTLHLSTDHVSHWILLLSLTTILFHLTLTQTPFPPSLPYPLSSTFLPPPRSLITHLSFLTIQCSPIRTLTIDPSSLTVQPSPFIPHPSCSQKAISVFFVN